MKLRLRLSALLIFLCMAIACGSPGVPLPPSLELAQPVTDLHAARKGNKVTLTWSTPAHTTERRNIDQGGTIEICRALVAMKQCGAAVGRIPFAKPTAKKPERTRETYEDKLPSSAETSTAANYFYAVSVKNSYGKSAGLSNQVQVPAMPTLSDPVHLEAQLNADGVNLSWAASPAPAGESNLRFFYRIYRRESGTTKDAVAGEVPVGSGQPTLTDHAFEWEKTYNYRVTVVTARMQPNGSEQQVEGDDSPPVRVMTHDIFPPATPSGLQAVFSGPGQKPFIDLMWAPDTEPDLAGYNVYRHDAGGSTMKVNQEPLKSPSYRDNNVTAAHEYTYSVSAIDVRGNESSRSEEASETVPPE